jgi:hypothetical protein
MKSVFLATAVAALMSTSVVFTPAVSAPSCAQLWHQRNSIFKDAGLCFRTPKGIRAFGNAGCQYDSEYDLPLSQRDRNRVSEIKRMERMNGC